MNVNLQDILASWAADPAAITWGTAVAVLLALILNLILFIRTKRLARRLERIFRSAEGADIEKLLGGLQDNIEANNQAIRQIERRQAETYLRLAGCLQHLGVVRFNAFDDTGSDLSFSVALLDDSRNGVVLSSIYGREESRTYAKPVQNGASSYLLTEEEQEALRRALAGRPGQAGKAAG